jgi:hypothetical protein
MTRRWLAESMAWHLVAAALVGAVIGVSVVRTDDGPTATVPSGPSTVDVGGSLWGQGFPTEEEKIVCLHHCEPDY